MNADSASGAPPAPSQEVRRSEKRSPKAWRVAMPLVLLVLGGAGFLWLSREPEKPKLPPATPQPLRTQVQELALSDYPVVVTTHGTVRAHQESTVSALVGGRIVRFASTFEDGGFFSQGDVLVELEAEDYRNAVSMAEARALGAKANLELARVNHERNLALLRETLLPQTTVDFTAASLTQAQAEVDSAAAQLDRARRDLERTRIRAPFDGCVRRRMVGLGQLVGPGTPLAGVFSVDAVEVRLPISSRELRFLDLPKPGAEEESAPGQEAGTMASRTVELRDAIDRESSHFWSGHVVRAEGALDENSLDLFVIARVEDPFGRRTGKAPLRIGQPVTGAIRGRVLTNVYVLPRSAVRELDRVLLIQKSNLTLRASHIVPLWSDAAHIVVRDGALGEGMLLATTHLVYAPDGAKVEILPSQAADMASADRTAPGTSGGTSKKAATH